MNHLSSLQVKELADNLLRMTNALGDYRYKNFENLSEEENLRLKTLYREQLEATTELYTKSAVLVMEDAQNSLRQIDSITQETTALYDRLTSVQKGLDRATSILTLASAIIGLDVNGIASSIKSLTTSAS